MEFDNSLNQACQWFADLMAKHDKGGHHAVEVGGKSHADMKDGKVVLNAEVISWIAFRSPYQTSSRESALTLPTPRLE